LVEVRTARVAHTETIRQRGEFLQFLDSLTPLAARMTGTAAAQVAAAPRAPESAPPQAPAPSAPGPAGFPAPFSVYGNAIPLDPQRRTFVEVSAGSFERELTGTYTFDFNYGLGTEKSDPFDIKMKITRSTVYTGFGAGESGLMRLGVGTISVQDTESTSSDETLQGRELVVDYRTIIGQSQGTSRGVFFASYRGGNLENDFYTGTFAQIDLGGGVTVRTSETISLYGGVVLSSLAAKLEATPLLVSETNVELVALGFLPNSLNAATLDAKAKTTMGLIFGLTAHLGASANLGLELHSGHESGTALNIGILF
jgi:hypothetical protein